MRQIILYTDVNKGRHRVVGILLNGIVHRASARRIACAVVIHTEATAHVDELDIESVLTELHIILHCLAQSVFDTAYLSDLAADMEMDEPQTVFHPLLFEEIESFEQFRRVQPELRLVASALFPFSRARRGEFDTDAHIRAHIQLARHLCYQMKLVELLYNEEDPAPHFLSQKSELDISGILIAVADNQSILLLVGGENGMKLGLRTRLKTDIELLTMGNELFDNRAHLIDLDRIDQVVLAFVVIFFGGTFEAARNLFDTVVKYVGKAQQKRRRHIAHLKLVHNLLQVDGEAVVARRDDNMAFVVYLEVLTAPAVYIIQLGTVFDFPFSHYSGSLKVLSLQR